MPVNTRSSDGARNSTLAASTKTLGKNGLHQSECAEPCANPPLPTGFAKVLERVSRSIAPANENGCRLWTGAASSKGYGRVRVASRLYSPHRVVLQAKLGRTLRRDEDTRHTCDVPRCCNPDHLIPGSRRDNVMDAVTRGRIKLPRSTATPERVAKIPRCPICRRFLPRDGLCLGTIECSGRLGLRRVS